MTATTIASSSPRATDDSARPAAGGQRLPWWNSFATVVHLEWQGAELNTVTNWIQQLVTPIAYLALLGMGMASAMGREGYLPFILPGIVVMLTTSELNRLVIRTVIERRWGLAAFKLQSGIPESAYFLGMMVPGLAVTLVQTAALGVIAALLGLDLTPLMMGACLVAAIPAAWFWSCLGYILTGWIRNYQTRDFIIGILTLPLTFSAPVFYSLDGAPAFLRAIATVNPLTYQVEFARSLAQGQVAWMPLAVNLAFLTAATVIGLIATKRMRRLSFEG